MLLGYCNTEMMVEFYKKSNLFLLPSFSDPSPLSLIEALSMKLPVLASERCGNHFEAVEEGINGYIFNPLLPESVRIAYIKLLARFDEWEEMGEQSKKIYEEKFNKEKVISNFIKALNAVSN